VSGHHVSILEIDDCYMDMPGQDESPWGFDMAGRECLHCTQSCYTKTMSRQVGLAGLEGVEKSDGEYPRQEWPIESLEFFMCR
jgi:hypothetical protein